MTNEEIKDLANVRLEQAKENLEEAELLFEKNKFRGANNRAYYSIFHSIRAILALDQKDFKKHSSVIAYFNQNYINKNIFPKELGRKISKASYYREQSDYVDFYIFSKEESLEQIETAKVMIKEVEKYLKENL